MITSVPYARRRRLVAITGAPGSWKSTIAKKLQAVVPNSAVVPMDGFHLDNAVLDARGLRARKGAPQTFDVDGLEKLVLALGEKDTVSYPLFDREQDRAIPDAGQIGPEVGLYWDYSSVLL